MNSAYVDDISLKADYKIIDCLIICFEKTYLINRQVVDLVIYIGLQIA